MRVTSSFSRNSSEEEIIKSNVLIKEGLKRNISRLFLIKNICAEKIRSFETQTFVRIYSVFFFTKENDAVTEIVLPGNL